MNSTAAALAEIKVADEAWIATALMHREHIGSEDFNVSEILERAEKENIFGHLRPGVYVHLNTHGVANRPPSPADLRMLFEPQPPSGRRRLFREGDMAHPDRKGKIVPVREQIPERYRYLLDWYANEYSPAKPEVWLSGIFEMIGAGKDLYSTESADDYVRRLREGWE
jgi:hypothetical protein